MSPTHYREVTVELLYLSDSLLTLLNGNLIGLPLVLRHWTTEQINYYYMNHNL